MNDHHIHSCFSGDCKVKPEKIVLSAISKNLDSICITDHLDIDYMDSSCKEDMFIFNPNLYFEELNRLKKLYHSKIKIYSGIEIGIQPHLCSNIEKLFPINSFDFKILSLHTVDKKDLHNGDFFKNKTSSSAYIKFFENLYYCIKNFNNYDVLGHINLIDRYSKYISEKVSFSVYSDIVESILKEIITSGKGIEINTSSYRYNMNTSIPSRDILNLYKNLGGKIIVFSSDSHDTSTIVYNYCETLEYIKHLGYSDIYYFNEGSFKSKKL